MNAVQQDPLMDSDSFEDHPSTGNEQIPYEESISLNHDVEFEIGIEQDDQESEAFDIDEINISNESPETDPSTMLSHEPSELKADMSDDQPENELKAPMQETLNQSEPSDSKSINAISLPDELSEEVDLIVSFHLIESIKFALFSSLIDRFNRLDKSVLCFGLDKSNQWHLLGYAAEELELVQIVFSLQLADRSGPVTDETLSQFQSIIEEISAVLNEQPEWTSPKDVIAYAQSLDAFCLEVDKTMHLHLVSGSAGRFTGTKFRGLAEASGLKLNANGEFQSIAHSGQVNFVLANMENNPFSNEMLKTSLLKGITFSLDIPRADHCAEAFNQMLLIAKKMQQSLSASLTDDRKKELSDHQIEKIRKTSFWNQT
jgi:hypothetical protein